VRYDVPVLIEPLLGECLVVVLPELALMAEEEARTLRSRNIEEGGSTEKEAESPVNQVYGEDARGLEEKRGVHVRRA
jgi:hypothetical protein